ncbi:hypothetical protein NDN08_004557 [Rhodosorus marinus]|uniref:Transmembrane protein n=1 Tax=Rhodosorus marinus TaxID=101924 RepID=A0AAV8ULY6_9RHOD|nr:hypothetical protein NDN08_004557 [Rhodosorus marinus]
MNWLWKAKYRIQWIRPPVSRYSRFDGTRRMTSDGKKAGNVEDAEKKKPEPVFLEDGSEVLYTGPFNSVVKLVKAMSLFSCAATTTLSPVVAFFRDGAMTTSPVAQIAAGLTMFSFGIGTTGVLTYVCSPYVTRMLLSADRERFIAERLDFFMRKKVNHFPVGAQMPADVMRPMVNFQAEEENYYLIVQSLKHEMIVEQFPWLIIEEDDDSEDEEEEEEDEDDEEDREEPLANESKARH